MMTRKHRDFVPRACPPECLVQLSAGGRPRLLHYRTCPRESGGEAARPRSATVKMSRLNPATFQPTCGEKIRASLPPEHQVRRERPLFSAAQTQLVGFQEPIYRERRNAGPLDRNYQLVGDLQEGRQHQYRYRRHHHDGSENGVPPAEPSPLGRRKVTQCLIGAGPGIERP